MRPPLQSIKHYVQKSLTTVTGATADAVKIYEGKDTRTGAADEVLAGSVVKAVFVEMWTRGAEASPGNVLMTLVKTQDGQNPTFSDMTNLHDYLNKRNILYHTQGLSNDNDADAIPFVRQWFKIPKGKQRVALGDKLFIVVTSQAVIDQQICGFATYKEYS